MRFGAFSFGSITIDGINYEHDVIIELDSKRIWLNPDCGFA